MTIKLKRSRQSDRNTRNKPDSSIARGGAGAGGDGSLRATIRGSSGCRGSRHELWLGDASRIRASVVRRQKADRRDAEQLLKVLMESRFPRIWVPGLEERDCAAVADASAQAGGRADARSWSCCPTRRGEMKIFWGPRCQAGQQITAVVPYRARQRWDCRNMARSRESLIGDTWRRHLS